MSRQRMPREMVSRTGSRGTEHWHAGVSASGGPSTGFAMICSDCRGECETRGAPGADKVMDPSSRNLSPKG